MAAHATSMLATDGLGPQIKAYRPEGALSFLGMAIYAFEGIGVVMPIMHACECPEKFSQILVAAIITLAAVLIGFSVLCYAAWGSNLTETFVLQLLPSDSKIVIITKIGVCINLICTYPIAINPANKIFEKWVFRCRMLKKKSGERKWLKNLQRTLVITFGVFCAVILADKIDKFLSLVGALFCAPLALTLPAMLHIKVVAKNRSQIFWDMVIIIVSFGALGFCTQQCLANWNTGASAH